MNTQTDSRTRAHNTFIEAYSYVLESLESMQSKSQNSRHENIQVFNFDLIQPVPDLYYRGPWATSLGRPAPLPPPPIPPQLQFNPSFTETLHAHAGKGSNVTRTI